MDEQTVTEVAEVSDESDDTVSGSEAGRAFAHRHIIEKINMFLDEYRRNSYTEDFVKGFIDGVNRVTGGNIIMTADDDGSDSEQVDTALTI